MAFNFWEAQRKARSKTSLYLSVFIFLTLLVALGSEIIIRMLIPEDYGGPIPVFGILFCFVTFGVATLQYSSFRLQGGQFVAEQIGARHINPHTSNFAEMQLLNIVQEIAIASSLPMPKVYVLDVDEINAFAAGLTSEDAVVAVTRGTLKQLNRDELQGVIAHEFGHIYNKDMKISMRLAAMIMGFYIVFILGLRVMQMGSQERRTSEGKGAGNIYIIALVMFAAGAITWLFGSILKACVSRQREYLADACAVQFTRNPDGIANALRKIARSQIRSDMPKDGMAFSHMYFSNKSSFSSIFATHPPIEERIAAIEGLKYLPPEWKEGLTKGPSGGID